MVGLRLLICPALIVLVACTQLHKIDSVDIQFERLAENFLNAYLAAHPEHATVLGDHSFDQSLKDVSALGRQRWRDVVTTTLSRLQKLPLALLANKHNRVDAEILLDELASELFAIDELKEWQWNALSYVAGDAFDAFITRDTLPLQHRLKSLLARMEALPEFLKHSKANLLSAFNPQESTSKTHLPPLLHTRTAIEQNDGVVELIRDRIPSLFELPEAEHLRLRYSAAQQKALGAATDFGRFLREELLPVSTGDERLGRDLYEKKLKHTLGSDISADLLQIHAKRLLTETHDEMEVVAREICGQECQDESGNSAIKKVLLKLKQVHPSEHTILSQINDTLEAATSFVIEKKIVSLPPDQLKLIVMPEYARGVSIAYCDSSGPLEDDARSLTLYAISPPPAAWSEQRRLSFFQEYNNYMLMDLTVHEAMPGHHVQLCQARRCVAPTRVRRVFASGTFAEGWATYIEKVMARHGFGGPEVRLQQLKMQTRLIINALLDFGVHVEGMNKSTALAMMANEGFQEEGEAEGKWQRALLTSCQLSTYLVGFTEVTQIARDLETRARTELKALSSSDKGELSKRFGVFSHAYVGPARPKSLTDRGAADDDFSSELGRHDAMLRYGTPPPKYLRKLLALPPLAL
eukprot:gnl/Spiro4/17872_TR9515_c0_g1_i1.p1 gnl/Spiro4/17872_TR9515_c0_g1~~gnl/Spiro4/17872_TR9515_c0_g1_i1.p1  ORF type:complete len:652 (+),score=102.56 gnl/Spiro4/17872_TR9515_c0_g1_i1:48-1958(+)